MEPISLTWTNPALIVSAFAAIIASLSLVWNILIYLNKNKTKVIIKLKPSQQMLFTSTNGKLSTPENMITVDFVNRGSNKVYIDSYTLELEKLSKNEKSKYFALVNIHNPEKYPFEIGSKAAHTVNFDYEGIAEQISKIGGKERKFRIVSHTTDDKRITSKWYSISYFE